MFIRDIKRNFYDKIQGKNVLMLVNYDIDAICACKILQSLFRSDSMLYTIVPVDIVDDLRKAYQDHNAKIVICINCGGTIDIVEFLQPEEDVIFYILDSHRPIDLANVYNESGQVILLTLKDDNEEIPDYEDIYTDESDEEEEEEEETVNNSNSGGGGGDNDDDDDDDEVRHEAKRQRLNESILVKRRERQRWETNRSRLLKKYTSFTYYSRSSAIAMYELAWKLSKDTFDLLWCGIVGLTEQMIMNKIDERIYSDCCADLHSHVSRLMQRNSMAVDGERNVSIKIELAKQLNLALCKYWTAEESLMYSVFSATKLKLWSFEGVQRMHEMLAEIGIPLSQCKQKFGSMEGVYKKEWHDSIVNISEKYGLSGIVQVSFDLQYGYRTKFSATDYVYALIGILQSLSNSRTQSDCFLEALEALSRSKRDRLEAGMEMAKTVLISVFKQVQNILAIGSIRKTGSFLHLVIQENASSVLFAHPYGIFLLAEFALKAYSAIRKSMRKVPLLISTPFRTSKTNVDSDSMDDAGDSAVCHVAAIPQLDEDSNKTFFGAAFERAAKNSNSTVVANYFDATVIQLRLKDRGKFFHAINEIFE